ncbi:MAG: heme exporter protein CcmD [Pseudomonadota bacterium]
MDAIENFLAMKGVGVFVWPAFAVALIVLGGLLVVSLCELRARERTLRALQLDDADERKP